MSSGESHKSSSGLFIPLRNFSRRFSTCESPRPLQLFRGRRLSDGINLSAQLPTGKMAAGLARRRGDFSLDFFMSLAIAKMGPRAQTSDGFRSIFSSSGEVGSTIFGLENFP